MSRRRLVYPIAVLLVGAILLWLDRRPPPARPAPRPPPYRGTLEMRPGPGPLAPAPAPAGGDPAPGAPTK